MQQEMQLQKHCFQLEPRLEKTALWKKTNEE